MLPGCCREPIIKVLLLAAAGFAAPVLPAAQDPEFKTPLKKEKKSGEICC